MSDENPTQGLARRMQLRQMDRSLSRAADTKSEEKIYAGAITDFLREKGRIVCISDDQAVIDLLRELVTERLKMPASCLTINENADMVVRILRNEAAAGQLPLLLIEEKIRNRSLPYIIRLIKNGFPEVSIILLCSETSQERLALLHECGASAFILKPVDMRALSEKLALTVRPQDQLDRQLGWARQLMGQAEYERALDVCRSALGQKAASSAVMMLIGDIYRAMQEYDKAAEAYTSASRGSAIFLEPLRKLADLYTETGDTRKQLEYLEKLDEISPLNVERKLAIGELYLASRRPDKARQLFDEAVSLSDREATDYVSGVAMRVASIYMDKDPQAAAAFLKRGLEARKAYWGPGDLAAFNRLGILLRREGKWREAAEEYRKALGVAPKDEILHYNLGMAYLEGGELESARASALKALALKPDLPRKSAVIACNLATIFSRTNDKIQALSLARQAIEQDPSSLQARELLTRLEGEA